MKTLLALSVGLVLSLGSYAQFYKNSGGLRGGYTSALTYKRFFTKNQALELMASGRNNGIQLTTLYQFNKPMNISFNNNFYFYYGVGAHVGYERLYEYHLRDPFRSPRSNSSLPGRSYFTMGTDAVLGMEYRWLAIPITIGVDVKPYLDFIGMRYAKFRFWDMGLSFKYIF